MVSDNSASCPYNFSSCEPKDHGKSLMPITTIWDNKEQSIIRHIYEGNWTWEHFHDSMKHASDMATSVNHTVGLIIDIRSSTLFPQGLVTQINRLHTRKSAWKPHITILVGANAFIHALYTAFRGITTNTNKSTGQRFMLVPTLEEAYLILQQEQEAPSS